MITMTIDPEKGFQFYLPDGTHVGRGFTPETGKEAAERFLKLLNDNEAEVAALERGHAEALKRNLELSNSGERGKFWPEFKAHERFMNKIQKQCNIVDS